MDEGGGLVKGHEMGREGRHVKGLRIFSFTTAKSIFIIIEERFLLLHIPGNSWYCLT